MAKSMFRCGQETQITCRIEKNELDIGFAQHYVECTVCDSNAQFHCNTCKVNLCEECENQHQRNLHDVVPYSQREKSKSKQERCRDHPDKMYEACCEYCEMMPVCMKCVKDLHIGHQLTDIEDAFKSKLKEFMDLVNQVREVTLTESSDLLTKIKQNKTICIDEISTIRSDLNSTAEDIKRLVDVILNEKNEILTDIEESLMLELHNEEKKITDFISKVESVLEENEAIRSTEMQAEFIMTQNERIEAINRLMDIPEISEVSVPIFQPGTFGKEDIEELFGDINEQVEDGRPPIPPRPPTPPRPRSPPSPPTSAMSTLTIGDILFRRSEKKTKSVNEKGLTEFDSGGITLIDYRDYRRIYGFCNMGN
ncbi:E3 ubiquitin-protein ligase TRIM45-like [Saccostrea cucullata]|uniref:E3 ubiquitin-protein ligase TRIM45-like n=1 Tax=Saccostrea cuccullata TaxID=36930 RepID=UPI002ED2E603